jgi:hypothetical protein
MARKVTKNQLKSKENNRNVLFRVNGSLKSENHFRVSQVQMIKFNILPLIN